MHLGLSGKVAIVTGAGRHIGRQIALTLAEEGVKVVVNDYYRDRTEGVATEISQQGGQAIGIAADVRNAEEVRGMVAKTISNFGAIHILVNNAGVLPDEVRGPLGQDFVETEQKDWNESIGVILYGVLNCSRYVLPPMVKQRYGKIVNITSEAARFGRRRLSAYTAAKSGVVGLTLALANELGRYRINVNCVSPGVFPGPETETAGTVGVLVEEYRQLRRYQMQSIPMSQGLGRLGEPLDIAKAVIFLASDAAPYITGQVLSVNGGLTTVDGPADWSTPEALS